MSVNLLTTWRAMRPGHRLAIRAGMVFTFMATLALALSAPAWAAYGGDEVAVEWDHSRYLVVNRWDPLTSEPSGSMGFGSVTTNAPFMIQNLLYSLAAFIARVFMTVVEITAGGQIVSGMAGFIDKVFATVSSGVLGSDGNTMLTGQGVSAVAVLMLVLLGLAAWQFARGGVRLAVRTLVTGVFALVLLVVMSNAAVQNQNAASGDIEESGGAFMSPRWVIVKGNALSGWVGGMIQGTIDGITNVLESEEDASGSVNVSECQRYIGAMHHLYLEGSGGDEDLLAARSIMVAFDDLMIRVLWDNARVAATGGGGPSSGAAWCRYSEMAAAAPLEQQVDISRTAGLYSDVVGFRKSDSIANASRTSYTGSAVDSAGTFTDRELAADIFGPTFESSDAAARAMYFWAACHWDDPGGPVAMSAEWQPVISSAASSDSVWQEMTNNTGWSLLGPGALLTATLADYFSPDEDSNPALGEHQVCQSIVENGLSSNEDQYGGRALQYGESYFLEDTLRPWNVSGLGFFGKAVAEGEDEAYEFYRATQGLSGSSFYAALGAVAATGIFAWFAFPIALGLLVSQLVGIIAWMFLPLALLLFIVPVDRTRHISLMAVRTILYSLFAAVVFQTVLQMALLIYSFVNMVIVPADQNHLGKWLLTGLSAVISFFMVKVLSKAVFTNDITTLRGALRQSTQVASRPLMKHRGDIDDNLGFRRPNFLSRTGSHALGSTMGRQGESLRTALLDRFNKKDAPVGPAPVDAATKGPDTATAPAKDTPAKGPEAGAGTKPDWRQAADSARRNAPGLTPDGQRYSIPPTAPGGPQVRGAWTLSDDGKQVTIPKDSTLAAASTFPSEAEVQKGALTPDAYKALSPQDRRGYLFDPVSKNFIPKQNVSGLGQTDGLSRDVVAPVSTLLNSEAPEGVSQEDWDKTAALRADIAGTPTLGPMTEQRKALVDEAGSQARTQAAATGHPLPDAPDTSTLAQQAPGVSAAGPERTGLGAPVTLQRHPDGSPKVTAEGSTGSGRFTRTEYNEDGTIAKRVFRREGQSVERTYTPEGTRVSETWRDEQGRPHRTDGPAHVTYGAEGKPHKRTWFTEGAPSRADGPAVEVLDDAGNVASQAFYLGGEQLTAEQFDTVRKAAQEAVGSGPMQSALGGASTRSDLTAETIADAVADAMARSGGAHSGAIAAAVDAATMQALDRQDSRMGLESQVSSAPVLVHLDHAQQQVMAEEAARLINENIEHYAASSHLTAEALAGGTRDILDGQGTLEASEALVSMVREFGEGREAEQLRTVMDTVSPTGSAMDTIEGEMERVRDHIHQMAERARDERTTAIRDRMDREFKAMEEEAAEQIRRINSELAAFVTGGVSPGMTEEGFAAEVADMQRKAFMQRAEIEERLAASMGQMLDHMGTEMSNAGARDESLMPLRESRERILENFQRVRGVRSWFGR